MLLRIVWVLIGKLSCDIYDILVMYDALVIYDALVMDETLVISDKRVLAWLQVSG